MGVVGVCGGVCVCVVVCGEGKPKNLKNSSFFSLPTPVFRNFGSFPPPPHHHTHIPNRDHHHPPPTPLTHGVGFFMLVCACVSVCVCVCERESVVREREREREREWVGESHVSSSAWVLACLCAVCYSCVDSKFDSDPDNYQIKRFSLEHSLVPGEWTPRGQWVHHICVSVSMIHCIGFCFCVSFIRASLDFSRNQVTFDGYDFTFDDFQKLNVINFVFFVIYFAGKNIDWRHLIRLKKKKQS